MKPSTSQSSATLFRVRGDAAFVSVVDSKAPPSKCVQGELSKFAEDFYCRTGRKLEVTSDIRTPEKQAELMWASLRENRKAFNIYGEGRYALAEKIGETYDALDPEVQKSKDEASAALTKVIKEQMSRNQFVSNHLSAAAVDLRTKTPLSDAELCTLAELASRHGAQVLDETRKKRKSDRQCHPTTIAGGATCEKRMATCETRKVGEHLHLNFPRCL